MALGATSWTTGSAQSTANTGRFRVLVGRNRVSIVDGSGIIRDYNETTDRWDAVAGLAAVGLQVTPQIYLFLGAIIYLADSGRTYRVDTANNAQDLGISPVSSGPYQFTEMAGFRVAQFGCCYRTCWSVWMEACGRR